MKYYSIQQWKSGDPSVEDERRYEDYIATIRHQLPEDLQRLCDFSPGWGPEPMRLYDAGLISVACSFGSKTIALTFDSACSDADDQWLGRRRFILQYREVETFHCDAGDEDAYTPAAKREDEAPSAATEGHTTASASPFGKRIDFEDYGWGEIELLDDGLIEHRMLFATGTEIAIRFRGFTLEYADTPDEPVS